MCSVGPILWFILKCHRYAGLASEDLTTARATLATMKEEWKALLLSESFNALQPSKVVNLMRWRKWKAIRLLYLMAEDNDWQPVPELQQFCRDMFKGFPDTKVVEDTHQKLRDLARDNRNFVSTRVKRMFSCMTSGQLDSRHTKVLQPFDNDLVTQSWVGLSQVGIKNRTQTRGIKLKDTHLQLIMHPKTAASATPEGLFNVAAATEWNFHYWKLGNDVQCTLDQAWQSVLMLRFDIVRHHPSQKTMIVIGSTEYAFQAWHMVSTSGPLPPTWALQAHMPESHAI